MKTSVARGTSKQVSQRTNVDTHTHTQTLQNHFEMIPSPSPLCCFSPFFNLTARTSEPLEILNGAGLLVQWHWFKKATSDTGKIRTRTEWGDWEWCHFQCFEARLLSGSIPACPPQNCLRYRRLHTLCAFTPKLQTGGEHCPPHIASLAPISRHWHIRRVKQMGLERL